MAYQHQNLAYDLRLFENEKIYDQPASTKEKRDATTVPDNQNNKQAKRNDKKSEKKRNNVVQLSQQTIKKVRRRNNNFLKIVGAVVLGVAVVVAISAIIQGQVQLTELNQKISNAKDSLSEKQSIYTQLEMKVDANISTSVVEDYAQNKLGMSKASNSQKEFVNLSKGDKAEVSLTSDNSVFESVAQAFSGLWS